MSQDNQKNRDPAHDGRVPIHALGKVHKKKMKAANRWLSFRSGPAHRWNQRIGTLCTSVGSLFFGSLPAFMARELMLTQE
mgnify:CR=1 FL=1